MSLLDRARSMLYAHSWLAPLRRPASFAARTYRYVALRGVVPGLRSVAAELLHRNGLVQVHHPLAGRVWLRLGTPDIAVAGKIFLEREYDLPLGSRPGVIVDAGAYIGISALWFAARYPDATIFALEPDPANFELLRRNAGHLPRVHLSQEALWWTDEPVSLVSTDGNPTATRVSSVGDSTSVPGITIATLMRRHGLERIDLLKLDIEGAELELFSRGADAWLPSVQAIALEVHEELRPGARARILAACRDFRTLELGRETLFLERRGWDTPGSVTQG